MNLEQLAEGLAEETREYVKDVTEPIATRVAAVEGYKAAFDQVCEQLAGLQETIKAIETRAPIPGPQGERGESGPQGEKGVDGRDGKDADVEGFRVAFDEFVARSSDVLRQQTAQIPEIVRQAVDALPKPCDGKDGSIGPEGPRGEKGDPGESVDRAEVELMLRDLVSAAVSAAVAKAVAAIPTPNDGRDGIDGKDGKDGRDGIDGKDGAPGLNGKDGADGRDGRDGLEGATGRDALEIEFVDLEKNLDRSYVRGTFGKYRGGIVRAVRTTDAVAGDLRASGWEIVVEGAPSFHVEHDGRRAFTIAMTRMDGNVETRAFAVPVVIDCGVYRLDASYEKGDGVTWGGSYWIAQREVAKGEQPGTSDAWRLAVKKGRDAK